jgi:hypothetical protein
MKNIFMRLILRKNVKEYDRVYLLGQNHKYLDFNDHEFLALLSKK